VKYWCLKLKPQILINSDSEWSAFAAKVIDQAIRSVISEKEICNVMLTGGNTVVPVYKKWAIISSFPFEQIRFFFSDERCVPYDHSESNYALVMDTLLAKGVPSGCLVERMEAEKSDREASAKKYEQLLPEEIDVLLLGMGEDGHIASLFPGSSALLQDERGVVPATGPKPPYQRLTITPRIIASARLVFLLVTGEKKGKVLAEALKPEANHMSLPVCLTLNGTWLLDAEAGRQVQK